MDVQREPAGGFSSSTSPMLVTVWADSVSLPLTPPLDWEPSALSPSPVHTELSSVSVSDTVSLSMSVHRLPISPLSWRNLDSANEWMEPSLHPAAFVVPAGLSLPASPQSVPRPPSPIPPSSPPRPQSPSESVSPSRVRKRALHRDVDAIRRARERSALDRLQSLLLPSMFETSEDTYGERVKKLDKVSVLEVAAQRLVALQQRAASTASLSPSSSLDSPSPAFVSSQRRQKSRFHSRKVACSVCRARKSMCDGTRPCAR